MVTTRSQTEADKRPKRAPKPTAKVDPVPKPTPKTNAKAKTAVSRVKSQHSQKAKTKRPSSKKKSAATGHSISKTAGDAEGTVLEKGILYFFARPKIDAGDDPHGADDIQRSFLVLRPIEGHDDTGPAPKDAVCRILVVPKKKLPSPNKHDRFLTFVKEPAVSLSDVAEQFKSETYMTKTKGERTQPAAVPIAEAVYALIASADGGATHLAYMLTVPDTLDNVQTELGIREEGSFVAQVRNPAFPAPPQAGIPEPPEYPEEMKAAFEGKRWMALKPEHLNFKHAEVLLIGAHTDVARNGKEDDAPVKEVRGDLVPSSQLELEADMTRQMEELEHEEEERVDKLGEDNVVFKDLRLRKEEFKKDLRFGGTWQK